MIVWAVATVNLPGLSAGTAAKVNADKQGIQKRIAAGYLRVCTIEESEELDRRTATKGE